MREKGFPAPCSREERERKEEREEKRRGREREDVRGDAQ
jgi:hypothetical protein